jgi:hypothetical protein
LGPYGALGCGDIKGERAKRALDTGRKVLNVFEE